MNELVALVLMILVGESALILMFVSFFAGNYVEAFLGLALFLAVCLVLLLCLLGG